MYSAQFGKIVCVEVTLICVVVVRADVVGASAGRIANHGQDEGVIKPSLAVSELNNIPGRKSAEDAFFRKGADALICCHKVVEIFHARP